MTQQPHCRLKTNFFLRCLAAFKFCVSSSNFGFIGYLQILRNHISQFKHCDFCVAAAVFLTAVVRSFSFRGTKIQPALQLQITTDII